MVFETENQPETRAPNRCYHATTPTASQNFGLRRLAELVNNAGLILPATLASGSSTWACPKLVDRHLDLGWAQAIFSSIHSATRS